MAIVCSGAAAVCTAAISDILANYPEIAVDTHDNTEFFVQVMSQVFGRRIEAITDPAASLQQQLQTGLPRQIDVIHVGDTPDRYAASQAMLAGLQQRWQSSGSNAAVLPRLLVHMNKRLAPSGPSRRRIGASVASEAIVDGLELDAPGRFKLNWLGRQGAVAERGRIYLYPYHPDAGLHRDEVDYPSLPRLLREDRVDMLCCVDPFLLGGVAARTLWARKAVPLVGMLHSIHSAAGTSEAVFQLLSGATFPFDAIISPSHCGAQAYRGLLDAASAWLGRTCPEPPTYQGRIEVIPYGIDTTFYQGVHKPSCRAALGLPHDTVLLLSLGRFSKREKADLLPLLLAVRELRQQHRDLMLILAGGSADGYPEKLRTMLVELNIVDCVLIYENLSADDKVLMYGAADLFVAISDNIQETYGLSLLEAMASGLPVVASAWNGYREIVRHGQTGFLVPTYSVAMPDDLHHVQRISEGLCGYGHRDLHETVVVDPFALTAHLRELLHNATLRHSMGAAGRRLCQAEYNHLDQSRKTGDFLLELLALARRTPWQSLGQLTPFCDPVSQRFAHYASDPAVTDATCVVLSPWGRDPAWQNRIIALLEIRSRSENVLLHAILAEVAQHGPVSVATLAERMQNNVYDAASVKPRIVRCLKYGFLQRVEVAP